jgi:hypothetical protein
MTRKKTHKNDISDAEFAHGLLDYIQDQRDAGRCENRVGIRQIEEFIDNQLPSEEASKLRNHIADCVFCMAAYAELQAAARALSEVQPSQAPALAAARSIPEPPTFEVALAKRVALLVEAFQQARRRFGHRAVQKQYSEPDIDWSPAEIDRSQLPDRLEAIERLMAERLDDLRHIRRLLNESELIRADLQRRGIRASTAQALLSQLQKGEDSLNYIVWQWLYRTRHV